MGYSPVSWLHIGAALAAIGLGLCVLLMRKGTRRHRRYGYAYVSAMLLLNLSSLFIFSLTGRFSLFHALALLSLATVVAGILPAWRRRPRGGWLRMHLEFMSWSYIGLLAAAASEAAVRLPTAPFWWAVAAASVAIIVTGKLVLAHNRPKLLARYAGR